MDLVPFFLLPLVGGYAFASTWVVTRYRFARNSGHHLYFKAVLYGTIPLAAAAVLHREVFLRWDDYSSALLPTLSQALGFEEPIGLWGGISTATVLAVSAVIGPFLGLVLNFHRVRYFIWLPKFLGRRLESLELWYLDNAIRNNDFERLLMRSALRVIPILLTLQTGKVFVGFAVRLPNPELEMREVRILPLLSGYRDDKDQSLHFVTNYLPVLELVEDRAMLPHLEVGDFEVVIPVEQIASAQLFDLEAYAHFKQDSEPSDPAADAEEPHPHEEVTPAESAIAGAEA